jgi:hypothetical protein
VFPKSLGPEARKKNGEYGKIRKNEGKRGILFGRPSKTCGLKDPRESAPIHTKEAGGRAASRGRFYVLDAPEPIVSVPIVVQSDFHAGGRIDRNPGEGFS